MKKILLILAVLISMVGIIEASTHSQLQNTNTSHELHTPGYSVANYTALVAETNMWCGDVAFEQDNGQEWLYQCNGVPGGTPVSGSVTQWVPFSLNGTYTRTFTPTSTLSPTPTLTYTNTPSLTTTSTFTVTPTFTSTITFTPTNTIQGTSPTFTPANTRTSTSTFTTTSTYTPTPTYTNTFTFTPTGSATPTSTFTFTSTCNASWTPGCGNQFTPTVTFTPTITFTPNFPYGNEVIFGGYKDDVPASSQITWAAGQAQFLGDFVQNLAIGDWVNIEGATQSEYNILAQITFIGINLSGPSTLRFAVGGNPITPSTGSPRISFDFFDQFSKNLSLIKSITTNGTGDFSFLLKNIQTSSGEIINIFPGTAYDETDSLPLVVLADNGPQTVGITTKDLTNTARNPDGNFNLKFLGIK